MRMSRKHFEEMKSYEYCSLTAYRDATGVRTIGYGKTFGVKPGMTITQEQADKYFEERIENLEAALLLIPKLEELPQHKWDALVSFTVKTGLNNLKKSVLLKKVQRNHYDKSIYREFLRWIKGGEQTVQSLLERRQWEAKVWEDEA